MKTIFLILNIFFSMSLYSQTIDPMILYNNISNKLIKISDFENIFFDLNKRSITKMGNSYNHYMAEEEFFNLQLNVIEGSFLNNYKREFLLTIDLDTNEYCTFFPGAANGGKTYQFYIFDENHIQIAGPFSHYYHSIIYDKVDINEDGIDEIFMYNSDGQMGCSWGWINIFSGNFNEPILHRYIAIYNNSQFPGEVVDLNSEIIIEDQKLIFNSLLDIFIVFGKKDLGDIWEIDKRLLRTEYKKDVYEFKNNKLELIQDSSNVNFDDERFCF